MLIEDAAQYFGEAAQSGSLSSVLLFIENNPWPPKRSVQAAAFGMSLVASQAVPQAAGSMTYYDTLDVLDQLARAKAEIGVSACHAMKTCE